jgi:hypothetical protein
VCVLTLALPLVLSLVFILAKLEAASPLCAVLDGCVLAWPRSVVSCRPPPSRAVSVTVPYVLTHTRRFFHELTRMKMLGTENEVPKPDATAVAQDAKPKVA